MNYFERFRVKPGTVVKLKDIDPSFKDRHENHKDAAKEIEHYQKRLCELQELLYADRRHSLLICLQAMDSGGKDGTINHVMVAMNPQGCRVASFKQPSAVELAHDFLWRVHGKAPARGDRDLQPLAIRRRARRTRSRSGRKGCLFPLLRANQRFREGPRRTRHSRSQVLSAHLEEGATEALQEAAGRTRQAMEDQRIRLQGTSVLG